jgi:hypothetical protein
MSKKFHAVHRETGQKWKSQSDKHQYLVMFDSGYLAVVTEDFYTYIAPLDSTIWKLVTKSKPDTTDSNDSH